jgi:hypothetical protein
MSNEEIVSRIIEIDQELSCGVTESKAIWLCYEMNSLIEVTRCRKYNSEIEEDPDFFNRLMNE